MALAIWSLFPEASDIHGDAGNAEALARRAGWRGIEAEVVTVSLGEGPPREEPSAILLGSGFDADAEAVLEALRRIEPALRDALAADVPMIAIGLGWELCSTSVELASGTREGLGIFPGSAVAAPRRTGDLIVDAAWGRLVGYEYHLRDYHASGERAFGSVLAGVGRAAGDGAEGATVGSASGTALHGPLVARNGVFADHLVYRMADLRGLVTSDPAPELARIDAWNDAIAARTVRAAGLR